MLGIVAALVLLIARLCPILHGHLPAFVDRATLIRTAAIAARDVGIPGPLAVAVMLTESGASNTAVSSSCARGPMQLMPDTAHDFGVSSIQDARENIYGGVRYLAWLRARYHGDLVRTVAAYNAGPGAVDRYHGVPPFAETERYVPAVLALALPLPSVAPVVAHSHRHRRSAPQSIVASK